MIFDLENYKHILFVGCINSLLVFQVGFSQENAMSGEEKNARPSEKKYDNILVGLNVGRQTLDRYHDYNYNKIGFSINPRTKFLGVIFNYDIQRLSAPNGQTEADEIPSKLDFLTFGIQIIPFRVKDVALIVELKRAIKFTEDDINGSMASIGIQARIRPNLYVEGLYHLSVFNFTIECGSLYYHGWQFGLKYGFPVKVGRNCSKM